MWQIVKWDENWHCASDILFEWPHFFFFFVHIVLYWEKVTSYEKFSRNLKVEFSKISIKMKSPNSEPPSGNYSASLHPTPHQIKFYYVSKIFFRRYLEMYRHLVSKCIKNAVPESQEMARVIFFLTPNRNMIALKLVKSEIFLAVLREHIIFNVK